MTLEATKLLMDTIPEIVPDLDKIENTNRWTAGAGGISSWTFDRSGFALVYLAAAQANAPNAVGVRFFVNNQMVHEHIRPSGGGNIGARYLFPFMLNEGDTVSCLIVGTGATQQGEKSCYFVPPKTLFHQHRGGAAYLIGLFRSLIGGGRHDRAYTSPSRLDRRQAENAYQRNQLRGVAERSHKRRTTRFNTASICKHSKYICDRGRYCCEQISASCRFLDNSGELREFFHNTIGNKNNNRNKPLLLDCEGVCRIQSLVDTLSLRREVA